MRFVQALYRVGDKISGGGGQGTGDASNQELIAKPGYAVGQVVLM